MPAADGWRVGNIVDGESPRTVTTMEEAAAAVPEGASVRLSLPVGAVLMERMRLPSTDREELASMVVLQLEKTVPYGGEELTSGFDVIRREENESDVMAVAVSNEQLDDLCEPLRTRHILPDQVGVFAIQLAAKYPGEEVMALIFREGDSTILAVAEQGKLVAAHACAASVRDEFLAELPRMLLAAELEGAPVNFTKVAVERELAGWIDGLKKEFGDLPVDRIALDGPLEAGPVNLVPAGWTSERQHQARRAKMRDWLMLAGAIYLFLLLAAAAYVIWLQREVSQLEAQVAQATPTVDAIATRKSRWTALAPAIDPTRYTVEILQQINQSIPSSDVHVTIFTESTPSQYVVEGEAPTANLVVRYAEALRANPALQGYQINYEQPKLEGEDQHAHFQIYINL